MLLLCGDSIAGARSFVSQRVPNYACVSSSGCVFTFRVGFGAWNCALNYCRVRRRWWRRGRWWWWWCCYSERFIFCFKWENYFSARMFGLRHRRLPADSTSGSSLIAMLLAKHIPDIGFVFSGETATKPPEWIPTYSIYTWVCRCPLLGRRVLFEVEMYVLFSLILHIHFSCPYTK